MSDPITDPTVDPEVDQNVDPDADPDDDGGDDGYEPPAREEWERVRRTLVKRQAEKKQLQAELAALRAQQPKDGGKPADPPPADTGDAKLRRMGALTALVESGLTRAQAKVAVRLVNVDSVVIDEFGDGDYDEAIAELKETFPGMFASEQKRAPAAARPRTAAGSGPASSDSSRSDTSRALLRMAGFAG